jgi:integrase
MRNITKRTGKDGAVSYLIRVSSGYDVNGKQIKKSMTYKPAPGMTEKQIEKAVEREAVMFEEKVKSGFSLNGNTRFADYAARWLDVNKARFAPITYVRYETLLVRINQAIGHIRLDRLQPMHLQEFYKNLGEIKSETTKKPLSPQTIKHYHRCISAILTQATREQIVVRNVASREYMDAPKVANKEPAHYNDEQARTFVDLLMDEEDIRIKAALTLLIYSGCRNGELCGLEWDDCDFNSRSVIIRRASQYCKGQGIITKEPKNPTSARRVKLSPVIFGILSDYKIWYLEQRLAHGDIWHNSNRLFIQSDGKPITPMTINKWLSKFIERHGLPRITPHSLRHTNITLLITGGVDIRTVAAKAGHSRPTTTLNIYD